MINMALSLSSSALSTFVYAAKFKITSISLSMTYFLTASSSVMSNVFESVKNGLKVIVGSVTHSLNFVPNCPLLPVINTFILIIYFVHFLLFKTNIQKKMEII